ncbi:MAG: hypothetical protein GQ574_23695 [Crocinitomix sp.]|nr:hypothetical protein [Crocinitomix sp.]
MNILLPCLKPFCIALLFITFIGCDKSDSDTDTYTITIGAFTQDGSGDYIDTGNTLIFHSTQVCQTWSRTAAGDAHSADSHQHYNAASDVDFNSNTTTFSWTEYGPELDEATIEATCAAGNDGVSKTVDDASYYQDKPTLFLKITEVVKN